jgi:DNA repair photolyase
MRWDNLKLVDPAPREGVPLPLFDQGAVVRRFDTPEFKGITFYEIRAKSIINRVPEVSRVPFRWTINPYRGCSHQCVYCLVGDTPILMADGRTKQLDEVHVGDAVYGTVREGPHRRYAVSEVLAHWQTVKTAYRITLEDGTELVASGDHRFLSDRGWAFVASDERNTRSVHLTEDDSVIGSGGFASSPQLEALIREDERLRVMTVKPLDIQLRMHDITTSTGDFVAAGVLSHNCFARNTHTYLDMDYGEDFNSQIVVKVNAPELLRKELAAKRWQGEHIAMGTNVDPYQRAEGRYKLMRGILEGMRDFENPFSILTKGSLILRDIDLLQQCAQVADVGTNVSVGSVDKEVWRSLEPGTPSPLKRLEVCRTLNDAGIPCGVLMAPIIPFITDSPEQLNETVQAVAESGATHLTPIVLHLRTGAREWFMEWLAEDRPDLVPRYEKLYPRSAYAPKAFQEEITGRVHELARKYGVGQRGPKEARRIRERVAEGAGRLRYSDQPPEQLAML